MPLLHAECKQASFAEDNDLFSISGYVADNSTIWWSLSPLRDKLAQKGESRVFFKWVKFFIHGVLQSEWAGDNQDDWIHTRKAQQVANEVHETVATSQAIVAFLGFTLRDSRTHSLIDHAKSWLPKLCHRAVVCCNDNADIEMLDMMPITVTAAGMVTRFMRSLSDIHVTVMTTFQTEWDSMVDAGELTHSLDGQDCLPLIDLVLFAFRVERHRRAAGKHVWPSSGKSGTCLAKLQKGIVKFLSHHIDRYVMEYYMTEHDHQAVVPSNKRRKSNQSTKITVPPDTIFEIVKTARDSGLSVREALKFLKNSDRLSAAAGCHENVIDTWTRRLQWIYDTRAVFSMAGSTHLNLVCDGSRHSGKEVMVSMAWSWQNKTAAACNVQVILPLDKLAPSELDLTDLIESLAQAGAQKKIKQRYGNLILSIPCSLSCVLFFNSIQ